MASIVAEAARAPNSTPHVMNPQLPVYLYGEPLEQLGAVCDTWATTIKDARGHRLRKDALCLLAGVISAGAEIEPEAWNKIKTDSVTWLHKKYGSRLRTVVEHIDEKNPHLHFYCVPLPGERFDEIHDGKREAATLKGVAKGLQNAAYRSAMRNWQDDFSAEVGIPNGLSRFGPRKRRLSRAAWKTEQKAHAVIAASLASSQELRKGIEGQAAMTMRSARQQVAAGQRAAREAAEFKALDMFSRKNLFGKLVEMITKFSKKNAELASMAKNNELHLGQVRESARVYRERAKRYLSILESVRPKYQDLKETVGHLKIVNGGLSSDLDAEREYRSIAENRLSRALRSVAELQVELQDKSADLGAPVSRQELVEKIKAPNVLELGFRR